MLIANIIILMFCCVYVGRLFKSLPSDIASMRMFKAEGKTEIYYGELSGFVFSWIIALLMIVFLIAPAIGSILFGWLSIGKLFSGF